jgi:hypothetical protein
MEFPTIKFASLIQPYCTESELTILSGVVLEKVCEYLYYNQKHADSKDVSDMDIPPELCLELLIAADFLDGVLPPSIHIAHHSYGPQFEVETESKTSIKHTFT